MNVTEAIAHILTKEDVEYLFGFPSNPLFDTGAAEEAGVRTIITRQERTAAHMADGLARMTGGEEIAGFACQHGPGTENSIGSIAQAYGESAPLVAIPAGYDENKTDVDPKFNSLLNYQHVSKTTEQLTDADAVTETMRRAFNAARNGRQRPSVVEVPKNVFYEDVGDVDDIDYEPVTTSSPGADPADVAKAAEMLLEADRPVIFAGQGVHYAGGWDELLEFAETLEAPVGTSLNAKSAFPEDHRLSLGAGSKSEPGQLNHFLEEADVIFGIGCSFTETAYGITVPEGKTIIHSTIDSTDIDKDVKSDHAILGDARLTLDALTDEVSNRLDGESRARTADIASEIESVREEWLSEWEPKLTSDATPINPYRVINELDRIVDKENSIATADAGNPRDFLSPFYEVTEPLSYIGWGKTTQLGYGLGLAMGAKLAHPEKLCFNIMGDGAIGMTFTDFETATREDIPILTIHLNNREMASYDTPFYGDFADVAEALGGHGERIKDPEEVGPAIERGIEMVQEEETPTLLEFMTQKETELSRPDLE